jgi:polygalacturonase
MTRPAFLRLTLVVVVGLSWAVLHPKVSAAADTLRPSGDFDVRRYGAAGDGVTLDTAAINRAIEAAHAAGGGTVRFPAGNYLSFSIRLRSRITLQLEAGATLIAATPAPGFGAYDAAEPNAWDAYQDFGHSHWHNSLIWGEDLEEIAILGPGRIHGKGLTRSGPGPRRPKTAGDMPTSMRNIRDRQQLKIDGEPGTDTSFMDGQGNKAIALKNCRRVELRNFSVLAGGHFAVLATGTDFLKIDHVDIDTNRDGFDIDACRDVNITRCRVNSPSDDAIVLKSSFALGYARATERVTIADCAVSGFDLGTLLDGTRQRTQQIAPDRDGVTGRIKIGTESNGGFKQITIRDCTFERCRGLALETVDGGVIEDVVVKNLTMKEVTTAPLFIRLGNRGRGPDNPPIGAVRRISISNVHVRDAEARYASQIVGLAGHPIEEVRLSDISIEYRGGGTAADAKLEPAENERGYPEPSMFGTLPVYGFFARHVAGLTVERMHVRYAAPEARPAVWLEDAVGVSLMDFDAQQTPGAPRLVLREVRGLTLQKCSGVKDVTSETVAREVR